jgi:hypothetical protein
MRTYAGPLRWLASISRRHICPARAHTTLPPIKGAPISCTLKHGSRSGVYTRCSTPRTRQTLIKQAPPLLATARPRLIQESQAARNLYLTVCPPPARGSGEAAQSVIATTIF